jgi:hypothetical protein
MENNSTIQELLKIKEDLLNKIKQIDITIDTIKMMGVGVVNNTNSSNLNASVPSPEGYNASDTLRQKVAFVIKREGRFLHVREISNYIHQLEPKFSIPDIMQKLTPTISNLRNAGKLVKLQIGSSNQNCFWGSPNWLNADKTAKAERKPKEQEVRKDDVFI